MFSCIIIYTLLVNSTHTRGGGLKIFYDRSTLPTHPMPQTLMHNHLHIAGFFRGLGACKPVVPLRQFVIPLHYSGRKVSRKKKK